MIVGIETDRGPWVVALIAAGYQVFAINPLSVARYRERHSTSGAKSDPGDAHVLAEIVRLDRAHHRPVAGDSASVEGLKLAARSHQSLIWDRTRQLQRLRQALREYFPGMLAALAAGGLELADPDALELITRAGTPERGRQLSRSKITAILARSRRRDRETKAEAIQGALRAPALAQPAAIESAYAAIAATQIALITTLNTQIPTLGQVVEQGFSSHPDAEIYLSQPGLGIVLGARVLGEFGDDPQRYRDAKSPQELRRHFPDHPRLRSQARRAGPLRPQPPPRRRNPPMGVLRPARPPRAPGPTTTNSAPATSATTPRYANSATASSASCTAASRPEPPTTRPPPGPTEHPPPLDPQHHGMSEVAADHRAASAARSSRARRDQGHWAQVRAAPNARGVPVARGVFVAGLVALAVAGVLLAVREGVVALPFALGMVAFLPQFFAGPEVRIAHGVLLGVGLLHLAWRASRS